MELAARENLKLRFNRTHKINRCDDRLNPPVVALVEEGRSHRSAVARFRVSVKFVNDMVILKRGLRGMGVGTASSDICAAGLGAGLRRNWI